MAVLMQVGDDFHIGKHVRFESVVRVWHLGANLHTSGLRIHYAGNQNDPAREGRLRKGRHLNLHLLTEPHPLEVFFEHVGVDPDPRDIDNLEHRSRPNLRLRLSCRCARLRCRRLET